MAERVIDIYFVLLYAFCTYLYWDPKQGRPKQHFTKKSVHTIYVYVVPTTHTFLSLYDVFDTEKSLREIVAI